MSLPLAVFFLALAPRLAGLGLRPFWYDEILTAHRAGLPLPGLIHDSFIAHHTPFYFILMAPFAHLPDPQFWLRLPSAVLGALAVMLVFLTAVRAGGITAGIAGALIIGLSPTEIAFSQEARSYMLMIVFLLVALHALTGLAQNAERAAQAWRAGGLGGVWLQFIAGSTAAFCTLGDSLLWLPAASITAGFMLLDVQNRSGLLRNFLAADVICLACCLPLYLVTLYLQPNSSLNHIPATTLAIIWYDIESIYLMRVCDFLSRHFMVVPTPVAVTIFIGAGLAIAAIGGILRLRRNPMMGAALLPAAFALPVIADVVSIWQSLLKARYLLWSGPPFAIIAGIGIGAALSKFPPPARYAALAAAALLLLINLIPYYHVETKPRWDIAAQIFASHAQPQDVAYFSDAGGDFTMRYYLPAKSQPYLLLNRVDDLQQAEQARAHGRRVWAVYGDAWIRRNHISLTDFQASLAPLGTPSAEIHAGSRSIMWLYDPAGK